MHRPLLKKPMRLLAPALLCRRLWTLYRDKIFFESLSSCRYATDIKTLLCKWLSLNKRNFLLLLFSRSDDNKGRLSFQFIYENVLASILPFVLWYFFDKTKGRFVTFSIVFLVKIREKYFAMRLFFYCKNSFVIFFHRLKRLKKLSQFRSWSGKLSERNKLWLFLSTW